MLQLFLLLPLIQGLWAVGCEQQPCDHICIDTVDSYVCQCFENWDLQVDAHTCIHERDAAFDNMLWGCFAEDPDSLDVEHWVWDHTATGDATVENCVHDCRTRAFAFAALQNGGECWCTNSYERIHGDSSECTMPCSGENHQLCGGVNAKSVYYVTQGSNLSTQESLSSLSLPSGHTTNLNVDWTFSGRSYVISASGGRSDKRYMGCYNEDVVDPDLPVLMWEASDPHSPQECNLACSEAGFNFAGVMDGGRCACGDAYGKHGVSPPYMCNVTCRDGWKEQNCGGENTNAVYRIVRAEDNSIPEDAPQVRASVPAKFLTDYPHTSGILTKRFILYASDVVSAPYEDYECYTGACYDYCGEIHRPEGIDSNKQDVVIRQLHIKLSDVPSFVTTEAQRVFVFAQTLVIDQSTYFNFSIYLRARQVIINYEASPEIGFDHNGPEFPYDIAEAVTKGPESDIAFMKLSTLCARMLLYSDNDLNERLGWAILDDIARDYSYTVEQKTYQDAMRNVKSVYAGLDRNGIKFAPYYTKAAFEEHLQRYYDRISIYRDEYEEMMDDITDCNNFVERAGAMMTIWTDTIVYEAGLVAQNTRDTLEISEEAWRLTYQEFNESRVELMEALQLFIDGIKETVKGIIMRAMLGLTRTIYKLATGSPPTGASQTADDVTEAAPELEAQMQGFPYAAENLAHTVQDQEDFLQAHAQMMTGLYTIDGLFDWSRFDGVVGIVGTLYVAVEEWQNIATMVDVTLRNPTFRNIPGCLEFRIAFVDFCRWGEALTRATLEHGENMRQAITAHSLYLTKVAMQRRYDMYFNQVERECTGLERAAVKWAEQNWDVVMDLNHALITFCQAYYYEEMTMCPPSAMPDFADSLDDLLLRVYSAINVVNGMGRSSSAVLDVDIVDTDLAPNCTDHEVCPINVFKNTGLLQYQTPLNHPVFFEIDLMLVNELRLVFHGAETTLPEEESKQSLRVYIEASGPFMNRRDGQWETFVSRAMARRTYQYNLVTGVIELYCDLYDPQGGSKIQNMTPFTTWMIRPTNVPNMDHIDFTNLNKVTITFMGSFLQGRSQD